MTILRCVPFPKLIVHQFMVIHIGNTGKKSVMGDYVHIFGSKLAIIFSATVASIFLWQDNLLDMQFWTMGRSIY